MVVARYRHVYDLPDRNHELYQVADLYADTQHHEPSHRFVLKQGLG